MIALDSEAFQAALRFLTVLHWGAVRTTSREGRGSLAALLQGASVLVEQHLGDEWLWGSIHLKWPGLEQELLCMGELPFLPLAVPWLCTPSRLTVAIRPICALQASDWLKALVVTEGVTLRIAQFNDSDNIDGDFPSVDDAFLEFEELLCLLAGPVGTLLHRLEFAGSEADYRNQEHPIPIYRAFLLCSASVSLRSVKFDFRSVAECYGETGLTTSESCLLVGMLAALPELQDLHVVGYPCIDYYTTPSRVACFATGVSRLRTCRMRCVQWLRRSADLRF